MKHAKSSKQAPKAPLERALTSSKTLEDPRSYALLEHMRLAELHEAFLSSQVNQHTRKTYANGIDAFYRFVSVARLDDLLDVEPRHVAEFIAQMTDSGYETATVRLYLSAVRMFLDACILDGMLSVNPAKSVRPPRHSLTTGKTPVIIPSDVRIILDSIPSGSKATEADLRDRALIGIMTFSFFRVSAAIGLQRRDYQRRGDGAWIVAVEKGSKRHEMPVHPTLEDIIEDLLRVITGKEPTDLLFQSSNGRGGKLTGRPFCRKAAWAMVGRRARKAGVTSPVCNHTFRATGITAYLNAGGNLEDARIMANHSNATTTKLYDRTGDVAKAKEIGRLDI